MTRSDCSRTTFTPSSSRWSTRRPDGSGITVCSFVNSNGPPGTSGSVDTTYISVDQGSSDPAKIPCPSMFPTCSPRVHPWKGISNDPAGISRTVRIMTSGESDTTVPRPQRQRWSDSLTPSRAVARWVSHKRFKRPRRNNFYNLSLSVAKGCSSNRRGIHGV
jgi:hypothetical protein